VTDKMDMKYEHRAMYISNLSHHVEAWCLFQSRKATGWKRQIMIGRDPTDRRKLSPSIRDRVMTGSSRSPSRFNDYEN